MTSQIDALTSLRGLAAWWVVIFHCRSALAPHLSDTALSFAAHGNLAVDMFFVLSGFVMYLNYAPRLEGTWSSAADFLYRRVARIYPLHLFMLLAFAAYVLTLRQAGSSVEAYDPVYFIQSLLLIQNWGFTSKLAWNEPAWSISTEMFAYLMFPVLVLIVDWRRWPLWSLAAIIVVLSVGLHGYFTALGYDFMAGIAQTGLVRCVVQFTIGTIVCAVYLRVRERPSYLSPALLAAAATLIGWRVVDEDAPVVPLIWVTLILGFALWRRANPLTARPFVWLGDISYATYLCHFLAFILFKLVFVEEGVSTPVWLVGLFFGALLLVSDALYRFVEKPAQRWMLAQRGRKTATAG